MNNIPALYDYENFYNSSYNPSTIRCTDSYLTRYFSNYLLQKLFSVLKWKLPTEWDNDYFNYVLWCNGFIGIVNTDKYGIIPQICNPYGRGIFYQPTHIIISNPLFAQTFYCKIGTNCEVIKFSPNWSGVMDIITHYADLMALCIQDIGINLINSKVSFAFSTTSKTMENALKKLFDKINEGNPAVFYDKDYEINDKEPWKIFTQNIKENYIVDKLLDDLRKIEQRFDNEIGIPNANTEKKERMIVDEVNANNIETSCKMGYWLENLQKCCKKVNTLFYNNNDVISVDWRYPDDTRYNNNGKL